MPPPASGETFTDMARDTMIQRVYEQVKDVLDAVCVATDDSRIEAAVKAFGGNVVMTSDQHRSGTDRVYEAYTKVGQRIRCRCQYPGRRTFHPSGTDRDVKSMFY